MLHIDAKLDYDTLRTICRTGHSRIPVYEDVEVNVPNTDTNGQSSKGGDTSTKQMAKKIIGILLVKQCVLLDPEGSYNCLFYPGNYPLLKLC